MLKTLLMIIGIGFTSFVTAEGSCDYCLADYNREWSACKGEEICRAHAELNYKRCLEGCKKR